MIATLDNFMGSQIYVDTMLLYTLFLNHSCLNTGELTSY